MRLVATHSLRLPGTSDRHYYVVDIMPPNNSDQRHQFAYWTSILYRGLFRYPFWWVSDKIHSPVGLHPRLQSAPSGPSLSSSVRHWTLATGRAPPCTRSCGHGRKPAWKPACNMPHGRTSQNSRRELPMVIETHPIAIMKPFLHSLFRLKSG